MHRYVLLLLAALLLSACASKIVLQPRSAAVPAGLDLSGQWRLQGDEGALNQARRRGGQVLVFLESGQNLKVTQTAHGLFMSFDRAIVEEYRFGENREINIGPVTAQRVSGWDGAAYVIETLDKDGVVLSERYSLSDDTLLRRIRVVAKEDTKMDLTQTFRRR
jgi:hypothetical protein